MGERLFYNCLTIVQQSFTHRNPTCNKMLKTLKLNVNVLRPQNILFDIKVNIFEFCLPCRSAMQASNSG